MLCDKKICNILSVRLYCLKKKKFHNSLTLNKMFDFTDSITVKTIGDPHTSKLVRLKLKDNLLIIRQELKKDKVIDNTLLFSKKYLDKSFEFAEITLEKEEDFLLNEILGNDKILYLKKCSKPDWNYLNELRKLDYGCTMIF